MPEHDTTRISLLIRIKDPRDTQAWSEFYELYAPILYRYARSRGLNHDDAEDVRATCYENIVRQVRHFEYEKERGGFKAWLRTLASRRVVDLLRKRREVSADSRELAQLPDHEQTADRLWEEHWRQQHLRYCMQQVRDQVSETTYQTFWLLVHEGLSVPEICQRVGINANQVYKAKARVLELVRVMMQNFEQAD